MPRGSVNNTNMKNTEHGPGVEISSSLLRGGNLVKKSVERTNGGGQQWQEQSRPQGHLLIHRRKKKTLGRNSTVHHWGFENSGTHLDRKRL